MKNIYKVILGVILIIIVCMITVNGINNSREMEEVQLQVVSTEYAQPRMRTIDKITYYRPSQFLVTFKDIKTKQYYLANDETLYNYLITHNNFIYNIQILKHNKNKVIMKIVFDNKSYFFEAHLYE